MIDFNCHCGNEFSVPQDLAGDVIQCPQCKRLNDVPLLSDLQNIDDHGNYKLDEAPKIAPQADRVEELTQVFTRDRYDAHGLPIDLRNSHLQMDAITPPTIEPGVPKYDPVTGELIEPIEIKSDDTPDPNTLPTAKRIKRIVNRSGIDAPSPLEVLAIPLRLLKPINLVVMSFILLAQVLTQLMMIMIAIFDWILVPFWLVIYVLIIAHFANVIDETGPTNRNELPTPLRHMSWHDDTFGPFSRVITALVICYGPSFALLMYLPIKSMLPLALGCSAALAIAGTIFFPATLLTTVTSGSFANLRPDRIVGVAITSGGEYIIVIITWIIGGALWFAGTGAINVMGATILNSSVVRPPQLNWFNAYGALIAGLFVLHFFCWHLGTLYRRHHERFPWVFQRHLRNQLATEPRGFPVAQKRAPRRIRA